MQALVCGGIIATAQLRLYLNSVQPLVCTLLFAITGPLAAVWLAKMSVDAPRLVFYCTSCLVTEHGMLGSMGEGLCALLLRLAS
jgi:hypothetical protein